ncbi:alpha/beta fold hydrolase [Micromonosporaceae bacterium Da 78-11]
MEPTAEPSDPTVVLVAQLGTGGDSWKPVLEYLDDVATFTYDRPGTGSAPGRPAPNLAIPHSVFARELAELLDQRKIAGPLVLVGHSFGALIARAFIAQYPDRVAGLVIVDGSIPQFHVIPTSEPKLDGDGPGATEIDIVAGQVEILSAPTPQVPSVVLTRTYGLWGGGVAPPHPRVEDLWLISQQILARELRAPLIVADDASHQIPAERPGLVAYTIDQVVAAARLGGAVRLDLDRIKALGGHLKS